MEIKDTAISAEFTTLSTSEGLTETKTKKEKP